MTNLSNLKATTVEYRLIDGLETFVRYHDTDVVYFDSLWITLNTGGFKTATTKRRMNQSAMRFGLGFNVYQRDYRWYVDTPQGHTAEFTGERVTFPRR